MRPGLPAASHDRCHERSRISSLLARLRFRSRRNQRPRELLDVVGIRDLGERIPLHRVRTEGVGDHIGPDIRHLGLREWRDRRARGPLP